MTPIMDMTVVALVYPDGYTQTVLSRPGDNPYDPERQELEDILNRVLDADRPGWRYHRKGTGPLAVVQCYVEADLSEPDRATCNRYQTWVVDEMQWICNLVHAFYELGIG